MKHDRDWQYTMSVSVLIPTYNRADLLPETIDSILAQTRPPDEIIVVDDGSTDNTQDIVPRLYPKIKYHRIPNSRVSRARNIAASFATSQYLALCDSDDLWRSDKLEKQMDLHRRFPSLECSFTNFSIVTDGVWSGRTKFDNAPEDFFARCESRLPFAKVCNASLYDELLIFQPIFPSTQMMTKDFFHKVGGYNEAFGANPSEDFEFTLRCVQHPPIGIITEPVVGIRKHTSNFSGNALTATCGEIEILNYALANHAITDSTKNILLDQIALRSVSASYSAFRNARFAACKALLSNVPKRYLTPKLRLKYLISSAPESVARLVQRLLN